jgi:hypothetical protein
MTEAKDARLVASVVFVEMLDYMKKSVAEQIRVTARFQALLSTALQGIPVTDRIVLDTGNGAAVSFLGAPQDALKVATKLRDGIAAEPQAEPKLLVRIGVNSGPVRLMKNAAGEPNIIGDGVNVAQSMMGFAEPGQIMASRAYYDAVAALSKDVAESFKHQGSRTDRDLREHQVYLVRPLAREPRSTGSATGSSPAAGAQAGAAGRNKTLRLGALGAVAAILVLAIGVRSFRSKPPEVVAATPPAVTAPVPAEAAPPETAPPPPAKAPKAKVPAKPKVVVPIAAAPAPAASAAAPAAPKQVTQTAQGSIDFAITPWGEVYVDGSKRGVSPPLTEVQVAPGKHTIEIRNTAFPSYTTSVDVAGGAQAKIKYKFNN